MQQISILGATGSIGTSTLNVIRQNADHFRVFALTAHRNVERLAEQIAEFQPTFAVLSDETFEESLKKRLPKNTKTEILTGESSLEMVATHTQADGVMAAIVGAAGLKPTLAAAKAGKTIFLANKEVLVMAGEIFCQAVKENNAQILPVDSEHNAIFQSLPKGFRCCVDLFPAEKILLTASGGAFLHHTKEELKKVTPQAACQHPNWQMGKKVSIDSASLMNKALEVIEAFWLFSCKAEQIEVAIHPQSILHSGVYYKDGALIAELGIPNMQTPIANALAYPKRIASGVEKLKLWEYPPLKFLKPDLERFPNLKLAFDVLKISGTAPAVLNAANEIAVELFLNNQILFTDIPKINKNVLDYFISQNLIQKNIRLEVLLNADKKAREIAQNFKNSR